MGFSDLSPQNEQRLIGNTTGSLIGNVGDRLKVNTELSTSKSPQADAFGRLRVSEPIGSFELDFGWEIPQHLVSTLGTSGGSVTYNSTTKSADMSVTSTTNSRAVIQTRRYIRYAPARSQMVWLTGCFNGASTNVKKRIGLFDDNNGIFFELNGSTFNVVIRSKTSGSVVDTAVAQTNWNTDKLDGTGASGIAVDVSKQQLFFMDFTWLGLGRVNFGFELAGQVYICHQFTFDNQLSAPYSQYGTLPVRTELLNTASTSATMHLTCAAVVTEGQHTNNSGLFQTVNTGYTYTAVLAATDQPILALRKKAAYINMPLIINEALAYCDTADSLIVEIYSNPSITGGSWNDSASGRCEYNRTMTAYSGGMLMYSAFLKGGSGAPSTMSANTNAENAQFFLGADLNGNSDILLISMRSLTGLASVSAIINYMELSV